MNIHIAGGGRVGFHLARLLSTEKHDITVIENDPNQVDQIDYALDVSTIRGTTASVDVLKRAGVERTDLFVAVSGNDEVNIVAASAAKGLGARQVVARVDNPHFLVSRGVYELIFNIDHLLSPESLAAAEIAHFVGHPGVVAAEDFGRGLVQMHQIRVTRTPTTNGKTLKDAIPPATGVLLGMISRNFETLIPHGDTVIEVGDLITLIGRRDRIAQVQKLFRGLEVRLNNVVIMGGSSIGSYLAQTLEARQHKVKLLEWNTDRANELAASLSSCQVICRDGTSRGALEEENVDSADVFVATTRDDERNIMATVLAKEVGADYGIAVVHQPDFAPLVTRLGIDHAVTPRATMANRVLKLLHQGKFLSLAVLEEGQMEIIELAVEDGSPVINKRLKDIRQRFPRRALVTTILRGDEVIVPHGDDQIRSGDSVMLIVASDSLDAACRLFQK